MSGGCWFCWGKWGQFYLAPQLDDEGRALVKAAQHRSSAVADAYEKRQYQKVINEIREIADEANKYFDTYQPSVCYPQIPQNHNFFSAKTATLI